MNLDIMVNFLRVCGEPTRLRLLILLSKTDLTVTDLTEILGQSQPRISRHLKLLSEIGLLERYQEGAWAYYRLAERGAKVKIVELFIKQTQCDDTQIKRDSKRLQVIRDRREVMAATYFSSNAESWDKIRSLHVDEEKVEQTMLRMIGTQTFERMLDLGTGTGRILELLSHCYRVGVGIDANRNMLSIARTRLDQANLTRVQTRQADLYALPVEAESFDLITIHQVLHFLEEPSAALVEAARAMKQGAKLLIVDFSPHKLKFLQESYAHRWMGFSQSQISEWISKAKMKVRLSYHLKPDDPSQPDTLTVSVWLAEKIL